MAEATGTEAKAPAKPKTEVTLVKMDDGREVGFAGKRKIDKSYTIDDSKIIVGDDGSVMFAPGAISVRIDLLNGKTVMLMPPGTILAQSAGHGLVQKLGDQVAGEKDIDDAYEGLDTLAGQLMAGNWFVERESSGGFSGASVVIKAIVEAQREKGKEMSVESVKAFLQKKLDAGKEQGLTRPKLYAAFRNPTTRTGQIIQRLEEEKLRGENSVDADAALDEMGETAPA